MAGIIAKSAFGAAKFATKYVVIPILYTALLGKLLQEAADYMREDEQSQSESHAVDPELHPAP